MILASSRAEEVKSARAKFAQEIMNTKNTDGYVSIHWRYDLADFNVHCKKYGLSTGICGHLNDKVDFSKLATAIVDKFLSLGSVPGRPPIYIASPPKEAANIATLKSVFASRGYLAFDGADLTKFLEASYGNCPKQIFQDQIHDFTSQIEMDICSEARFFLFSEGSSWSKNICMERAARKSGYQDRPIMDFIE